MSSSNNGTHRLGPQDDDEDLKDLLGKGKDSGLQNNNAGYRRQSPPYGLRLVKSLQYQIHSCCFLYPATCGIIMIGIVAAIMWLGLSFLLNPTQNFGEIKHDHSNIKSKLELQSRDIDHWCLGGGDDSCTCDDPLVPLSRYDHKSWIVAFKGNRKKIFDYTSANKTPDVAFLGESIVEEMDGRWLGQFGRNSHMSNIGMEFRIKFDKNYGAQADGIALGIAGDTASNVLWRLMHGEMPDEFHPKVWWLFLGMDDLARAKCSEEVVVLGILRVVEEIMEKRPKARIVINSLLPMTALRGDSYPVISDINDAERTRRLNRRLKEDKASSDQKDNGKTKKDNIKSSEQKDKDKVSNEQKGKETDQERKNKDETVKEMSQTEKKETKKTIQETEDAELEILAEKEEADRDKQKKKNRIKNQTNMQSSSVTLKDKTKMKKFKAGRIRQNKVPLWTSIKAINRALSSFANLHSSQVTFFDATKIFTTAVNKKKTVLREGLIGSRGMLSPRGYRELEDAILATLIPILTDIQFSDNDESHLAESDDYVKRGEDDTLNAEDVDDQTMQDDFLFGNELLGSFTDDLFGDLEYGEGDDYNEGYTDTVEVIHGGV